METKTLNCAWGMDFIVGNNMEPTGYLAMHGIIRDKEDLDLALDKKTGERKLVGFCSYLTFPSEDILMRDACDFREEIEPYLKSCKAWFHGFRNPDIHIKYEVPKFLLSVSDFSNPPLYPKCEKKYDFVYVCAGGGDWGKVNKNAYLMKQCLPILCEDMNLECALINIEKDYVDNVSHENITFIDFMEHKEYVKVVQSSRFVFIPNIYDSSPRVLSESLALGTPALVNKNIVGGWKYINENTGLFFENEIDVGERAAEILDSEFNSREWFFSHYGPENSSRRFAKYMHKIDPSLEKFEKMYLSRTARLHE